MIVNEKIFSPGSFIKKKFIEVYLTPCEKFYIIIFNLRVIVKKSVLTRIYIKKLFLMSKNN